MEIAAIVCLLLGAIFAIVFGIQLLITAFQTSIWWGLGYIFVPFVALFFIIAHWDDTKKPFLRSLIAIPLYVAGFMLMPGETMASY